MNPTEYVFSHEGSKGRCIFYGEVHEEPVSFFRTKKKDKRQKLEKYFFRAYGLPSLREMPQIVRLLWELPERECQYAAMDIMEKF